MDAAKALREARLAAGLTQRALAAQTSIAQPTIARIEAGHVDPRLETLDSLLHACGAELRAQGPAAIPAEEWAGVEANLRLSPQERIEKMLAWAQLAADLRAAAHA